MNRYCLILSLSLINYCLAVNKYYTYDKIDDSLHAWQSNYGFSTHLLFPDHGIIYNLDTIGYSSQDSLPIFAVKLSDNANLDEDEAQVLILGQCHAEEIYGVEIAMALIECFIEPGNCNRLDTEEYGFDKGMLDNYLSTALDKLEIWVVPTHNPEGLKVVHGYCDDGDSETTSACSLNNGNWVEDPSYRKNGKDVNNNGTFIEPDDWLRVIGQDMDGVDLNRNYDLNWIFGHDKFQHTYGTEYASCNTYYQDDFDYYKGESSFSEKEIQAIRDFALDKKFILSIAYHSSRSGCIAEKVIFPWGWKEKTDQDSDRKKSPDYSVIKILGDKLHDILGFPKDGDYYAKPQGGRYGNAHDWFYRETGCFQYLIEVGDFEYDGQWNPDDALLIDDNYDETLDRNLGVLFYLFMNAVGGADISVADQPINLSLITGVVRDEEGNPIENAIIKVLEMDGLVLKPRKTDEFGRYRRLLIPDSSYTLVISASDHVSDTINIDNLNTGINIIDDIVLNSQPLFELTLNIQTPFGYDHEVEVFYNDSFTTGMLTNLMNLLPRDNYKIRLNAEGLSPVIINTYLDNNMEYNIQLNEENILLSDDFSDLSNWEILNGNWIISGNTLKSQTDLFYENNIQQKMKSNIITAEEGVEYVVIVDLRYELEWGKDFFSMMYVSGTDTAKLLTLTGDNYEFYTEYIPLFIHEGQSNGQLLIDLVTDQNLNYRGVEINNIILQKSGEYTSTTLNNSIPNLPDKFTLEQNLPNPFNPETRINFSVPRLSPITISIYNLKGELIEELINDIYEPGNYKVNFNATGYASGIYFYRLKTGFGNYTRKLMIIK